MVVCVYVCMVWCVAMGNNLALVFAREAGSRRVTGQPCMLHSTEVLNAEGPQALP